MTPFSELFEKYPVRYTKLQKDRFLGFLESCAKEYGYTTYRQNKGRTVNLICGDIGKSETVYTAHYDTAKRTKRGIISRPGGFSVVTFLKNSIFNGAKGPNLFNSNDNDSGVYVLLLLMEKLKGDCAFVFFDGEEDGLKGSKQFYKKYKKIMKDKTLINFDCVGNGDRFFIIYYRKHMCGYANTLAERIGGVAKMTGYSFSTDACIFLNAVNVTALSGEPGKETLKDIHCDKDKFCDEHKLFLLSDFLNQIK